MKNTEYKIAVATCLSMTVALMAANYVIKEQDRKLKEWSDLGKILIESLSDLANHAPPEVVERVLERAQFNDIVRRFDR